MPQRQVHHRATLADVAELAGVSPATASKAINNRAQVHPATRERVLEAAEQLGFRPNAVAQSLTNRRTGTVGLLTSDLEGRFVLPVLMGAEDAFGAGAVSVFLCDARGDAIREQHHLRALLARQIDGLIVVGRDSQPRASLGDLEVPTVYVMAPSLSASDRSVIADDVDAGRLATEHLVAVGRRRIAYVTGLETSRAAQDRLTGAGEALAEAGLQLACPPLFGPWSTRWGRAAGRQLVDQGVEFDAVLCGSDIVARGVLDAMHEAGRSVPGEVALLGFDNLPIVVEESDPQLSSVDLNLERLGKRAAEIILQALAGSDIGTGIEYARCTLVARGSTVAGL